MARSRQKNKYFDKTPKAANKPNSNQSIVLLCLNPRQQYKTDKAQKGNWQTYTLNSGVVKL